MSKQNSRFQELVAHAARVVTTPTGLDGGLQLIANGSPIVAALLLKLAQARASSPILAKGADPTRLTELAAGIIRGAGTVSEARVVMRTFGLLPMLDWLLRLHPNPVKALVNFFVRPSLANLDIRNEKVFQTVRVILLSMFYVGEHSTWLASKGIIRLTPEQISKVAKISIRSWAIDICASAVKLLITYRGLNARYAALSATGEKDSEEAKALAAEYKAWKLAAWVNFGWVPLTIHWSSPNGVWTNPLITAALACFVSVGKLNNAWNATA